MSIHEIHPTDQEFLSVLFGADAPFAHVTSFLDDPSNIPNDRRFKCWGGDYWSRTSLIGDSNQYFTISTFMADSNNKARRRKTLFRCTHVIVADDVKEKLPIENVNKLPLPTYKLETSPGSEQWGWVLDVPCTNREQVENLLDGLVAQGLAPAGKDPGMKGVTRYVRLPEGVNTKASRVAANGGTAPRCRMLEWHPERKVSIEALAEPFSVQLDAPRRESRVDGAANLPDHPLLDLADIIYIKDVRSDGRFDVTCPWVGEHTDAADDGAAIFTNNDGSIGFKCHHGSCQGRTGNHLLDRVEQDYPGFRKKLANYKLMREFSAPSAPSSAPGASATQPVGSGGSEFDDLTFLSEDVPGKQEAEPHQAPQSPGSSVDTEPDAFRLIYAKLRTLPPTLDEAIETAMLLLKAVDPLPHTTRLVWHNDVRDYMGWTKPDFKIILEEGREVWYAAEVERGDEVYREHDYIVGLGQFYSIKKNLFLKPELFQNGFCHIDPDIRTEALVNNRCRKVDMIDYAPGFPKYFHNNGLNYVNTWYDDTRYGAPGDATPWLAHFDALGWSGEDKLHILRFMAHTVQHPEDKINHAIILGGGEGIGKDLLMFPLMQALGRNAGTIHSKDLTTDYNDYLLGKKFLVINELDAGNYAQANVIANRVKGFVTAPPDTITINQKNVPLFPIRNIVNVMIGTNEALPLRMSTDTRRYFVLWSDLRIRDENGQVSPEWTSYFHHIWTWIRDQNGWMACVDYLNTLDLSGFSAKQAPRVTDALKDIQEASQDPVMAVFHDCVTSKLNLFKSDLLTIKDIYQVMRKADLGAMGLNLKTLPSINILGKIIKQSNAAKIIRTYQDRTDVKLYCVRNKERYLNMGKKVLLEEYQRQISGARAFTHLAVVQDQTEENEYAEVQ